MPDARMVVAAVLLMLVAATFVRGHDDDDDDETTFDDHTHSFDDSVHSSLDNHTTASLIVTSVGLGIFGVVICVISLVCLVQSSIVVNHQRDPGERRVRRVGGFGVVDL